jgi:hypothetical protein
MSTEEKDNPAQNAPKTFSEIMEKLKAVLNKAVIQQMSVCRTWKTGSCCTEILPARTASQLIFFYLPLRHEKIFGRHIIGLYFSAIGFVLSRRMQRWKRRMSDRIARLRRLLFAVFHLQYLCRLCSRRCYMYSKPFTGIFDRNKHIPAPNLYRRISRRHPEAAEIRLIIF